MDFEKLIRDMTDIAVRCGSIMLQAGQERVAASEKSGYRDIVTRYDALIQQQTEQALAVLYPQASFCCEEGEEQTAPGAGLTFVIDPIDGTTNFARGLHHSCISAAALWDGVPAAGVIYNPYIGEAVSAVRGHGTFCNGRRVNVAEDDLKNSLVMFGTSPYRAELYADTYKKIGQIYGRCLDLRRSGSAALDLEAVAAGRIGLFFEESLCLWDYAAGALLVEEAGGMIVRLDGSTIAYDGNKSSVLAGSKENVRAALELFAN